MVRIQVEFIEVSQQTMTDLLYSPRKSANDTDLRDKLQEFQKKGAAKMLESQLVTARSGEKATSEAIHEFIYPTEYDPPAEPSTEKGKTIPAAFPVNPATPTAFETRNVGSTLEVEPTIGEDSNFINIRFVPELVYHTGNVVWTEVTKDKDVYKIQMPSFYTIRLNSAVTLARGQPFLVGAVSPKDDKGDTDSSKKVLIFLRADVVSAGR